MHKTHLSWDGGRVPDRLTAIGAMNASTVKIVNRFSCNGNPLYHQLKARAAQIDCGVSYDGMVVEI